jgi:uncharacterized protein involved in exopolysaccharide biosynthesis
MQETMNLQDTKTVESQPYRPGGFDEEIDPVRHLVTLWQNRWVILGVTLACGLAAGAIGVLSSPAYEASVRLQASPAKITLPDETPPVVNLPALRAVFDSQSIAAKVVSEFRIDAPPLRMTPQRLVTEAITVEPVRDTNLLTLKVRLGDRDLPAKIANRFAELAVELAGQMSDGTATRAREGLKAQADQAREALRASDQRLTEFRRQAQIEVLRSDVDMQLGQRGKLPALLAEIREQEASLLKAEEELARRKPLGSLKRSIDSDPALTEAAREVGRPGSPVIGLTTTSEYVDSVYADLERQVAQGRARLSGLRAREAELTRDTKARKGGVASLELLYAREGELRRLEGERDLAKTLYLNVDSRYGQALLDASTRGSQLRVVDPAPPVPAEVRRKTLRNTMLALVLGAIVASVLVLVKEIVGEAVAAARRK